MTSEDVPRPHQVDVEVDLIGGESDMKGPGHRDHEGDGSEFPQDHP